MPGMPRFTVPSDPPGADAVLTAFPEPPGCYVHVPFCTSICPFCPYDKVRYERPVVERYFGALRREVDLYARHAPGPFGSVYVGGGTPTLCLDELAEVLARLEATGERAIEVLPNHMTEPVADRLCEMGFGSEHDAVPPGSTPPGSTPPGSAPPGSAPPG
jgi:oxygen-independent coproporphyrinogen-3 oxidase